MTTEPFMSTEEMAEAVDFSEEAPESNITATEGPTQEKVEFFVQMRSWTMTDMESLIVEAAAKQLVRDRSDTLKKAIEARAAEMIQEQINAALTKVTAEIIDQPITPKYGNKAPVTMRELIGLSGKDYLTTMVDPSGNPSDSGGWGSSNRVSRMHWLVDRAIESKFKTELSNAVSAAVNEIRAAAKVTLDGVIAKEKARLADALSKITAS